MKNSTPTALPLLLQVLLLPAALLLLLLRVEVHCLLPAGLQRYALQLQLLTGTHHGLLLLLKPLL